MFGLLSFTTSSSSFSHSVLFLLFFFLHIFIELVYEIEEAGGVSGDEG
jgi:hypothetical protein